MPVEAVGLAPDPTGELFVARQPIFNRKKEIYGYELLHRSGMENRFDGTDNARATSNVIAGSFLTIGMNRLVGPSRAFINFDRTLLLSPVPLALPPEKVVIELLETIEVDDSVIARCRELRKLGFAIALDDYNPDSPSQRLLDLASIVKIDFRLMDSAARKEHVAEFRKRRIALLAEKVETPEEFQSAVEQGFKYFQGYFFARPSILRGSSPPPAKSRFLRLLETTSRDDFDFAKVEDVLRHESALSYQLMRYLNSALFGWNSPILSVRHALALLGAEEIRRWAAIVTLCGLATDKPGAILSCSVIRAKMCESVAKTSRRSGLRRRSSELFIMGLFSLLDAVLNQPLEVALRDLHIANDIRETLLESKAHPEVDAIYSLVKAFERGVWSDVTAHSETLGIPGVQISKLYCDAVEWGNQICG